MKTVQTNNPNLKWLIGLLIFTLSIISPAMLTDTASAANNNQAALVLHPNQTEYLLGNYIEYLEDPKGTLTLEQVSSAEYNSRFLQGREDILNFGLSDSVFWLRLHVRNEAPDEMHWRLELARPTMNTVVLYRPNQVGSGYYATKTGYVYPFATREIPHEGFVFDLHLPSGSEQVLYMMVKDKSMELVLRIWETTVMQQRDIQYNLLAGLSIGGMIIMLVYNIFMTIMLRDISFVYYTLFQASLLFHFSNVQSYSQRYLWPKQTTINEFIIPLMVEFVLIAMMLFAGTFFKIKNLHRGWRWTYWVILAILGLCVILTPFIKVQVLNIVFPIAAISAVYIFLLAVWSWLNDFKPARFYLVSWTIFLFIAVASVLERFGWFSSQTMSIDMLLQYAAVYVVAFQSLALADRFNLYRQEMINTQSALVANQQEALRLKDELTRSLETSTHELELKVSERTQTLQELNLALAEEIETRKKAQHEAEILARTDPLTELYNRRYFSQMVEIEFAKAIRYKRPLSIMIMDIDHFKNVNDTFGHHIGDQALTFVARIFEQQSRRADILARYGGEEFVALLPETNLDEAYAVAERLRSYIEAEPLNVENYLVKVTVSIGVAGLAVDGETTFGDLLKQADEALYQAKDFGRNRVITYPTRV